MLHLRDKKFPLFAKQENLKQHLVKLSPFVCLYFFLQTDKEVAVALYMYLKIVRLFQSSSFQRVVNYYLGIIVWSKHILLKSESIVNALYSSLTLPFRHQDERTTILDGFKVE